MVVIIVGGGISGAAAASYLATHHIPVIVLEAKNRLGGRIYTVRDKRISEKSSNSPNFSLMEMGAKWLHTTVDNMKPLHISSYPESYLTFQQRPSFPRTTFLSSPPIPSSHLRKWLDEFLTWESFQRRRVDSNPHLSSLSARRQLQNSSLSSGPQMVGPWLRMEDYSAEFENLSISNLDGYPRHKDRRVLDGYQSLLEQCLSSSLITVKKGCRVTHIHQDSHKRSADNEIVLQMACSLPPLPMIQIIIYKYIST